MKLFLIRLLDGIDVLTGHRCNWFCTFVSLSNWWDRGLKVCPDCGIEYVDGWTYKHADNCKSCSECGHGEIYHMYENGGYFCSLGKCMCGDHTGR